MDAAIAPPKVPWMINANTNTPRLGLKPASRKPANNPEQEEAEEEVGVEYNGGSLEIGFNVSYLLDVLLLPQKALATLPRTYILPGEVLTAQVEGSLGGLAEVEIQPATVYGYSVDHYRAPITTEGS